MMYSARYLIITIATWMFLLAVIYRSRERRFVELTVKTTKGYVEYSQLEKNVFLLNNFKLLAAAQPLPVLDFVMRPTCEQIFTNWLQISSSKNQFEKPPEVIPEKLRNEFLLNGYSTLIEKYQDNRAEESPREWNQISKWMELTEDQLQNIALYPEDSMSVYYALKEYPPQNKKGLVVGSLTPWVEVFALRNGAKEVLTVDYQKTTIVGTDKIKYLHPIDLAQRWQGFEEHFDFVISFSSIEHSGLGRYGDPLDPIGDLREIWKTACLLKPKGYFYIGLPRGQDSVVFNLHRIYGVMRLAMVMTGFEWIATYRGDSPVAVQLTQSDLEYDHAENPKQDLFVLRKL